MFQFRIRLTKTSIESTPLSIKGERGWEYGGTGENHESDTLGPTEVPTTLELSRRGKEPVTYKVRGTGRDRVRVHGGGSQ